MRHSALYSPEPLRPHVDRFGPYGVDGFTPSWMQKEAGYLRQARINIDGLKFAKEKRGDRPVLKHFLDVTKVIDPK